MILNITIIYLIIENNIYKYQSKLTIKEYL